MTRLAFLCDPHLGDSSHDPELRKRVAERLVGAVTRLCSELEIDRLVLPGDIFDSRKPPAWAYAEALAILDEGDAIMFDGNHDAEFNGISPLDVLAAARPANVSYARVPQTYRFDDLTLLALPWVSRTKLAARIDGRGTRQEQYAMMTDLLRATVLDLVKAERAERPDVPIVAATHFTIAGAAYNSDVQPELGESSELLLPANVFDGCDLVVAGHVHNRQVIGGNIIYPGSASRHDFGEEGSHPSLFVVDSGDVSVGGSKSFELPAVKFLTVEVLVGGSGMYAADFPDVPDYRDTIVRFDGTLPSGPETASALATFSEKALKMGATKIGKPKITFARHDHREVSTTTVSTSPTEALNEYITAVGGDFEANREGLLELHSELLAEVHDAG